MRPTPTIGINLRNLVRWILGLIFVWAAISKLADVQDFYSDLRAYRLPLPDGLLRLTAMVLPWLELCCGLMLLLRLWLQAAMSLVVGLCVIFLLSTGQAWARGLQISCGCLSFEFLGSGGGAKSAAASFLDSTGFAFMRDLLLLIGGLYLLRRGCSPRLEHQAVETLEQ